MRALSSTSIATALVEQGDACAQAYDVSGAIRSYKAAIAADPNHRAAYVCLGSMLLQVGRTADAVLVFGKAAERWPDWILPWWAAAVARIPQSYRDASEIVCVRADYVAALREMRARAADDIASAMEALGEFPPFQLPYQGHDDRLVQTGYGGLVTGLMGATYPQWSGRVHRPWRPGEPLRVGIVCGAFRRHSGWRLPLRGWVEDLDRERFKVFGYHTEGRETEAAASLFDRFVQGPLRLGDWARCIEADAPHVLIFAELGMDATTAQLAGLRLAPVQCTSWGHSITSGRPTIDYYLSSNLMEPLGAETHYTERLVRLPGIGTAYRPEWGAWGFPLPAGDVLGDVGFPADAVRFVCCQSVAKYLPQHDGVFPRIAAVLPTARFVFVRGWDDPTEVFWRRLEAAFARQGLDAREHCMFLPRLAPAMFSAVVRDAHVFLDTFDWSGCNTTLLALEHGVPVVTLPGRFMRGRHSYAILTAAGVTDTIAKDTDDYAQIAIRLGRDAEWRQDLSARMRVGAVRLFNDVSPVRGLEDFLVDAVARHTAEAAAGLERAPHDWEESSPDAAR